MPNSSKIYRLIGNFRKNEKSNYLYITIFFKDFSAIIFQTFFQIVIDIDLSIDINLLILYKFFHEERERNDVTI